MTIVSAERPLVGVGVIVISDGALLVIKRGGEIRRGDWAVPGGKVHYGETMAEAAIRETKEETGLDVELGQITWVGDAIGDGDPPDYHIALVDFTAKVVGGKLAAGDDAVDVAFVQLGELRDLSLTPSMHRLLDDLGVPTKE